MRIIARRTLRDFWGRKKDAEQPLKAWFHEAKRAKWKNPGQIKSQYRSASIVGNNRVVFNVAGNKYRLVVAVNYRLSIVYIRFIGTHAEYDKIDVEKI
ncbi:MAG: type II toxin-antitoxin system HigB family toxin [Bacteroidetes bacterium]|nr:type II toxin-antitoxin system HigB family toxin [Bacteroidota bacterium]